MKSPSFQFYPADFIMGTTMMTAQEAGAYIRLLCYQWDQGALPNDDAMLGRLAGCDTQSVAIVRQKFVVCSDNRLRNARLERVRAEQIAYRQMQSEKGKLGGRPRKATDNPKLSRSKATVKLKGKPEESPPSPSSVSVSDSASDTAAAGKLPRVRERDAVIDAIARCECSDLGQVTGLAWGRYAKVRQGLSAVWPDKATLPSEIGRRMENLRLLFPRAPATATSLLSHWAEVGQTPPELPGINGHQRGPERIADADEAIRRHNAAMSQ